MNHQTSKRQAVQIILTLTVDKDLTMNDIKTLTDEIVNLIRNFLRKLLRLQPKALIRPVILEVIPLPFSLKETLNR